MCIFCVYFVFVVFFVVVCIFFFFFFFFFFFYHVPALIFNDFLDERQEIYMLWPYLHQS